MTFVNKIIVIFENDYTINTFYVLVYIYIILKICLLKSLKRNKHLILHLNVTFFSGADSDELDTHVQCILFFALVFVSAPVCIHVFEVGFSRPLLFNGLTYLIITWYKCLPLMRQSLTHKNHFDASEDVVKQGSKVKFSLTTACPDANFVIG